MSSPGGEPTGAPAPEQIAVRVRRSPKVGVIVVLGALIGALAALVLTLITPAPTGSQYSTAQVLGYSVLVLAPVGAALGGIVGVVLDRISVRRSRITTAERVPASGDVASPDSESID